MTLALVHLLCEFCGAEQWTRVPLLALVRAVECAHCRQMAAYPKVYVPLYLIPAGSELEYGWYATFPDAVLEDQVPCR